MGALMAKRSVAYRPKAAYDIESAVVCVGQVLEKRFDDELLTHHGMRTYRVGQYRLFYTFTEEALTLWRVLHTRHDLDDYALMSLDD